MGPVKRNPVEPLRSASAAVGELAPAAAGPASLGASSTRHGGVVVGSTAHSAAGGPRRDGGNTATSRHVGGHFPTRRDVVPDLTQGRLAATYLWGSRLAGISSSDGAVHKEETVEARTSSRSRDAGPRLAVSDPRSGRDELSMAMNEAIETELEAWRSAERRQERTFVGDTTELSREVEQHRAEYMRLSTEHIVEWMAGMDAAQRHGAFAQPARSSR